MAEDNNNIQQEQVSNESTTQATQQADTSTPKFEIPTEALDFVGEGKKYKSAEDALKSVPHAQEHIKTLEEEMALLKEELTRRKTAEELLDEMKSGIQPTEVTPQGVEIDQDRLMQLVTQTIEQKEQQSKAKQNAQTVASKFTEQYGAQAEEAYNKIAQEAGLTVQQLNNLAATSPNVVMKLAGFETKSTPVGKPSSSINTQALNNTAKPELSAKVPKGASTKDMLAAWRNAGEKVKSQL